ncbi:MAG: hypothetical protein HRT74_09160 [Flavobacteriales bacterium]|nr:hypothetical protein [Flavobacteriales bacterium]
MKYFYPCLLFVAFCAFSVSAKSQCDTAIVSIITEVWGHEISWEIVNGDGDIVAEGADYESNSAYSEILCLEQGCYEFLMYDQFGDGWNGAIASVVTLNEVVFRGSLETGEFGSEPFGISEDECAPEVIIGCTDPEAENYDENATFDDGSCEYPCMCDDIYEPLCFYDQELGEFITYNNACEASCDGYYFYYSLGTCDDPIIYGCTDPEAINFSYAATEDDGSCQYPLDCEDGTEATIYICTFANGDQVALDLLDSEGNSFYSASELGSAVIMYEDICIPDGCLTAVMSNVEDLNGWYGGYFWIQVDGETIYTNNLNSELSYEEDNFSLVYGDCGECECGDEYDPVCVWVNDVDGYTSFPNACEANCAGYWDLFFGECDDIFGCMDPLAGNYNPNAIFEDGSCEYIFGCTDENAINYDPEASFDDGSCTVDACNNESAFEICYENNAYLLLSYENTEGGPVFINITSGYFENSFDVLTIYDGETNEILFSGDGDVAGINLVTTGSILTTTILSFITSHVTVI